MRLTGGQRGLTIAGLAGPLCERHYNCSQRRRPPSVPASEVWRTKTTVGTVAACAFAAVLYRVVTGGSVVDGLGALVADALATLS